MRAGARIATYCHVHEAFLAESGGEGKREERWRGYRAGRVKSASTRLASSEKRKGSEKKTKIRHPVQLTAVLAPSSGAARPAPGGQPAE